MEKPAKTRYPIHDLLARRWSPRAFSGRGVEPDLLRRLLEAARWAPSCFNEQPWSFIVATQERPDDFQLLADCLVEGNRWARNAPVLMLSVAKLNFEANGKPNRHAYHDVGLALGNLIVQATGLGLVVHPMAGFDVERARNDLQIPASHDPVAMIAIGYQGDADSLPDKLREREKAERKRKNLEQMVFGGRWASQSDLFG